MNGAVLRNGQRWEFHNATRETVTEYELVSFGDTYYGPLARLRNIETDGLAHITCRWLYEGDSRKPHSHWCLITESGVPVG